MKRPLPYLDREASCAALRAGELLIFPTETFYALGCDAMNADAIGAVFSLKKRSLGLPLPVVIAKREHLDRLTRFVPPLAEQLIETYWPGPLSIVLSAKEEIPDLLTADAGRVAVRFSPHPAVHELCLTLDMILVASSANISGLPPVIRPEGLSPELLAGVAGVYAAKHAPSGGLPSTVIDVVTRRGRSFLRVLRPGVISIEQLLADGFPMEPTQPE